MKKKILLWGGTVFLTAGILTGCGKMTKEELLKQSKEAMEKTESYGGDMELDCEIRVGVGEYSQSMDLYGELELKVTPDIVYIGGNIGSETAFLRLPMEMYVEMSEDGESSTVYMNIANEWQKNEAEQGAESERNADLTEAMQDYIDQYSDNLQLSEEMGEVEGEKTYILSGTLEGSTIQELFDLVMGETADAQAGLEELGIGLDFSAMNFEIEMQYFKKTKLPASVKVEMKEAAPLLDSELMQMSYESLNVTLLYRDYGKVGKIEIPQEALDAKEADTSEELMDFFGNEDDLWEDDAYSDYEEDDYGYEDETDDYFYDETELLTDEDGNYIVMDYDGTVQVSIPARGNGYQVGSDASSTWLYFEKENESMYSLLEYTVEVFNSVSSESDLEKAIPLYASYLEADAGTEGSMYQNVELSEQKEKEVNGQTVKYQYITYLMQGVPCCWGNAWVVSADGSYALLVSCNLSTEDNAGNEDWVEDAFAGITVVNYLTNLVSAI